VNRERNYNGRRIRKEGKRKSCNKVVPSRRRHVDMANSPANKKTDMTKSFTNKILIFNLVMAVLFILSYQFMTYLFSLIFNRNYWDNLILFIGYVPLRGVGYVVMPNFPVFVFILTIVVDGYYLARLRKSKE